MYTQYVHVYICIVHILLFLLPSLLPSSVPLFFIDGSRLPNQIRTLDFNDTFLSFDHVQASFPQYHVKVNTDSIPY